MSTEELTLKKPKQKRRYVATEKRKAQQAKYLKPRSGYHPGQKSGRPKQHAEVVGRIRDNAGEILDTLFSLMRKARLSPGDKTRYMVCEALLDRGFGRAPHTLAAAIQHHTGLDRTASRKGQKRSHVNSLLSIEFSSRISKIGSPNCPLGLLG